MEQVARWTKKQPSASADTHGCSASSAPAAAPATPAKRAQAAHASSSRSSRGANMAARGSAVRRGGPRRRPSPAALLTRPAPWRLGAAPRHQPYGTTAALLQCLAWSRRVWLPGPTLRANASGWRSGQDARVPPPIAAIVDTGGPVRTGTRARVPLAPAPHTRDERGGVARSGAGSVSACTQRRIADVANRPRQRSKLALWFGGSGGLCRLTLLQLPPLSGSPLGLCPLRAADRSAPLFACKRQWLNATHEVGVVRVPHRTRRAHGQVLSARPHVRTRRRKRTHAPPPRLARAPGLQLTTVAGLARPKGTAPADELRAREVRAHTRAARGLMGRER